MENCCLWINGKKVSDARGIRDNFNLADVRGYYLGGSLARWLYSHNAENEARQVEEIPNGANPDKFLTEIFGKKFISPAYHTAKKRLSDSTALFVNGSFNSSYGGSYRISSGLFSSYKAAGSYSYEFEYEHETGSFRLTSFWHGSSYHSSWNYGSFGSYINSNFNEKALLMYFTSEPLNCYGYGIQLI